MDPGGWNAGRRCGGYRIFAPTLMLHPETWPFVLSAIDPVLSRLWYGGIAIYVVLVPVTLIEAAVRRQKYDVWSMANYSGCVFFFLPSYLSSNGLFLLTAWTVVHGAQYLVVVGFHSLGPPRAQTALARSRLSPLSCSSWQPAYSSGCRATSSATPAIRRSSGW